MKGQIGKLQTQLQALGGKPEKEAGLYAREDNNEAEVIDKPEPEYQFMVLRNRDDLGLHSGGRDRRKDHAVKERKRPASNKEEQRDRTEEPSRHPKDKLASQATSSDGGGRKIQTCLQVQCGISESEDFDVLLGTDPIWGVGMTICTWKERVQFRKQYWIKNSEVRELPVQFVRQESKRAYAVGEAKRKDVGSVGLIGEAERKDVGRVGLIGKAVAAGRWQVSIRLVELFGGIGAGLAAVVKAGIAVKDWVYVEKNEKARKMAEHHARMLQKENPELLEEEVIDRAMRGVVKDVREITPEVVRDWGHVNLLVAGWESQGVSRAGKGRGMEDPRGAMLLDLLRVMDWIKERQEKLVYLLEHLDLEEDCREPVRKVRDLVRKKLGKGVRCDAARLGGMRAQIKEWEEPTALEPELAMGYEENATKASGVTEQKRRRALGQAMDGQVMLWFVRRMWRGVVLEAEPEREKPVREVQKMGAWATIPVKDEAEWVIGDTMGKEEKEALQAVLAKFRHAFAFTLQELEKCTGEEMELKLTSNEPVFQRKRRKAPGNKDLCKEKCKELLEAGLIQRSESEYATPTVIAARKDLTGEVLSRRMCGDYRALNRLTVPDRYPMPTAEEIFDKLGEGEIFSTLDLRQGFNQIRIKKEDVRKIAFHGADGLYEWLFMPFGLRNASAIFQRVMDSVLRGLECAACYIDDVVIFSKMEEEHVRDVERTLEALSAAGLTCHPKKCRWGEATVQYLGYEQASSGAELPVKGGQEVGVGSRGTLRDLMEAVQTATVLELPQADKPFALYTDWSSQGMGAILCQELDGEERVVAYASRSCSPVEAKYSSYHGEGLASIWVVKHFRVYLQGREFTLITDHQPLQWLMTHQGLTGRNTRWAVTLQVYDFKIRHRPGKTLKHVDGLSRNPSAAEPVHTLMNLAKSGEVAAAGK
ncbi:unnamed protein product [Closterium sp. NIES-53]